MKARMKITDVKLIRLKARELVGSIELAWNEGGLIVLPDSPGLGIEIDPAYIE